ncbi:MAG: dihydrofolate reductase family protein [Proteobacteria bacterium]|nr:dihydrofolate reductase family protein [Pseudomonadota bacterium]
MVDSNNVIYPKVSLLMVMSVNGVVAQNIVENSFDWSSEEDREQFLEKTSNIGTVIMGANTYRSIGSKPYEGVRFYVMTNTPDTFRENEKVSFHQGSIKELLFQLAQENVGHVALLGGPQINAQCFEHNLVDDIYLTIEPLLMPDGMHLATSFGERVTLKLESLETLNEANTLLLKYRVVK